MFNWGKKWDYRLVLTISFNAYRNNEITPQILGKEVAKTIKSHIIYKLFSRELDPIISGFKNINDYPGRQDLFKQKGWKILPGAENNS